MDQACSFLAGFGTAKHIEFDPLRYTDITIPDGVVFVIANSLVEMNKSKTAGTHFNVRVVECRTAAQVQSSNLFLVQSFKETFQYCDEWRKFHSVRQAASQ